MTLSPTYFGLEIKARRREFHLTQVELANKAGVAEKVVYKIERGTGSCNLASLLKVLDVLDLSMNIYPTLLPH